MGFSHSFKALLAFVLMVAASLSAPMAMAAPMATSGHAMEPMAECPSMPVKSEEGSHHQEMSDETCCAATCLGTAIAPAAAIGITPIIEQPTLSAVKTFSGVLSEIATPPPRLA